MDTLEILLKEHGFRGRARRVCCFAHTLNLTAKATLRQFEKKKKSKADDDTLDTPDFDDIPLLEPIDDDGESDDDMDMQDLEDLPGLLDEDGDDGKESRDEEEIVNVFERLTVEEQERWKEQVKPLRSALYKASR
jgi:hypothetical protein